MNDADREGNYANRMNGQYNSNRGDLTAASRTLMISGIPSTYCTKEFLQRHFQVSSSFFSISDCFQQLKLVASTYLDLFFIFIIHYVGDLSKYSFQNK